MKKFSIQSVPLVGTQANTQANTKANTKADTKAGTKANAQGFTQVNSLSAVTATAQAFAQAGSQDYSKGYAQENVAFSEDYWRTASRMTELTKSSMRTIVCFSRRGAKQLKRQNRRIVRRVQAMRRVKLTRVAQPTQVAQADEHSARCKRTVGSILLNPTNIETELQLYLAAHEAQGIFLDDECQEIAFMPGVDLILHKEGGVRVVDDVLVDLEMLLAEVGVKGAVPIKVSYIPVFAWRQIKQGYRLVLAHVLLRWRRMKEIGVTGLSTSAAPAA